MHSISSSPKSTNTLATNFRTIILLGAIFIVGGIFVVGAYLQGAASCIQNIQVQLNNDQGKALGAKKSVSAIIDEAAKVAQHLSEAGGGDTQEEPHSKKASQHDNSTHRHHDGYSKKEIDVLVAEVAARVAAQVVKDVLKNVTIISPDDAAKKKHRGRVSKALDDNAKSDVPGEDESSTTPSPPPLPSEEQMKIINTHDYVRKVYESVRQGRLYPEAPTTIPVYGTPLFKDSAELVNCLNTIDTPVRLFVFVWNSDDSGVKEVLEKLKAVPFGVYIHHPPENIGFSGAVNVIMTYPSKVLKPKPKYYFLVNADASFPNGILPQFAQRCHAVQDTHGLIYGPRQDHFAFVVTQLAIDTVGLFDEVFFPGYMEDIDYHWRVRMGGLPQLITGLNFNHAHSVNMHKGGNELYKQQIVRNSAGWEYGWSKWGKYTAGHIENDAPPSGWKTPFNIPNAPLSLWAIDPAHRECVKTGRGTYHISSSTCWYSGKELLKKLPDGTQLPSHLLKPTPGGG